MKISKALGASLLTAALVAGPVCAATAAPEPAAVQTPAGSTLLDLFKASNRQAVIDVFDETNKFRAAKGLKPLKFNANISAMSQKWTDHMSTTALEHSPDFTSPAPAGWTAASENIAMRTGQPSGAMFVQMWANSPGHNVNMSRAADEYLGIGVTNVDHPLYQGGVSWATQNFFRYQAGTVPEGSYNHPRDFFNGLPQLPTSGVILKATALAPTWDIAKRTYTIPQAEGVEYVVGSRYEVNMKKVPGTYTADDGYHTIQAVAKKGYQLTGIGNFWTMTFPMLTVSATAPVFNKAARTFTIPVSTGVQYLRDGYNPVKAGIHSFHDTARITATAARGYVLAGTAAWNVAVPLVNVVPKPPTFDKAAGTYTIPAQAGVQFIINHQPVTAGTYKSLEYVYVSARATNGYTMSGAPEWVLRPGLDTAYAGGPFFADYSNLFLIPSDIGVQYYLNGKAVEGGRYTGTGKVTVTATAKSGYRIDNTPTSWSYDYTPPAVKVAAAAPTFNRLTGQYTVPAKSGLQYYVDGKAVKAGTYKGNGLKVAVTAKATAGYVLSGTSSWTYTFTPVAATPTSPSFSVATGRYTVPAKAGVQYFVDGTEAAAGTYSGNSRLVVITAKAAAGYTLSGTSSWTYDFRRPVTPTKPAMSNATHRYTIPAKSGAQYYVDGRAVKAGTYSAANGKTLTFTVKASSSTYRLTGMTAWSYRF